MKTYIHSLSFHCGLFYNLQFTCPNITEIKLILSRQNSIRLGRDISTKLVDFRLAVGQNDKKIPSKTFLKTF